MKLTNKMKLMATLAIASTLTACGSKIIIIQGGGCNNCFDQPGLITSRMASNKDEVQQDGFSIRAEKTSTDIVKKVSVNAMDGINNLFTIEATQEVEVTINTNVTINNGKFKLVMADANGQDLETIFEGNKQGEIKVKAPAGKTRFTIVGSLTQGNIKMDFKIPNTKEAPVKVVE